MPTLKTFEQLPLKEQRRLKQLAKQIGYREIDKAKRLKARIKFLTDLEMFTHYKLQKGSALLKALRTKGSVIMKKGK